KSELNRCIFSAVLWAPYFVLWSSGRGIRAARVEVSAQTATQPNHMFRKILIANRGEIAIRVIRACRDLNVSPIAIFSEADAGALHVRLADEAYCIGPAASSESYLKIQSIIDLTNQA